MKILKLIIPNFQQFRNFELDLTHPDGHEKAGTPLEKVCLIGTNGTGKSTILGILNDFLKQFVMGMSEFNPKLDIIIGFELNKQSYYCSIFRGSCVGYYDVQKLKKATQEKEFIENFTLLVNDHKGKDFDKTKPNYYDYDIIMKKFSIHYFPILQVYGEKGFKNLAKEDRSEIEINTSIYSPAESVKNSLLEINDVPNTTLYEALKLNDDKKYHIVSNETIIDFWTQLMFLMEQRDIKLKRFAQANKKNTYEDIVNEFDQNNSKILKEIAFFWNKILDKSNLYFDYESAKNPIQFLDNLQAYIKNKHTHEVIPYNALSTGIRNFMFRLGHIYSLYFNKNIENGFLLVDEPENSLFPDFLYDLIDIYLEIIGNNTQFFVATHNPIIASQFEPYERVILRFDDEGFVQAHRGESPVGDDPNDLLENDFAVRNLMPRQGRDAFKTYQNLRRTLRETTNEAEKEDLMTAIATLGRLYNF